MPIVTIVAGLSSKANDAIFVLLLILVLGIISSLFAFVIAKGINLYREHQKTEALARKVWDTEARRIAEEEEKEEAKLSPSRSLAVLGMTYGKESNEFSVVPSFPPIDESPVLSQYIAAFPAPPTFPYDRPIVVTRMGALSGRPLVAWTDDVTAVSVARNMNCYCNDHHPGPSSSAVPEVVLKQAREKRKILGALSSVDVERRRSNGGGGRRNGPRTAGKENNRV